MGRYYYIYFTMLSILGLLVFFTYLLNKRFIEKTYCLIKYINSLGTTNFLIFY